eukprot:182617-Rhodomonas_salina.1
MKPLGVWRGGSGCLPRLRRRGHSTPVLACRGCVSTAINGAVTADTFLCNDAGKEPPVEILHTTQSKSHVGKDTPSVTELCPTEGNVTQRLRMDGDAF